MARSTIWMARSTPAQKPRGVASRRVRRGRAAADIMARYLSVAPRARQPRCGRIRQVVLRPKVRGTFPPLPVSDLSPMRRLLLVAAALVIAASSAPRLAYTQMDGGAGGGGQSDEDDPAKKKKRDNDWGDKKAPLTTLR